jgi:hypothetical protein
VVGSRTASHFFYASARLRFMSDLLELILPLVFDLVGQVIFERLSEKALGWLEIW